jgi:hypothetical protein
VSHSVVNDISTPPPELAPELAYVLWDVNDPPNQESTATDPSAHSGDENYASHLDLEAVNQNPTFSDVPNRNGGEEDPPLLLFSEFNGFCLQFPKVPARLWMEGLNKYVNILLWLG